MADVQFKNDHSFGRFHARVRPIAKPIISGSENVTNTIASGRWYAPSAEVVSDNINLDPCVELYSGHNKCRVPTEMDL